LEGNIVVKGGHPSFWNEKEQRETPEVIKKIKRNGPETRKKLIRK